MNKDVKTNKKKQANLFAKMRDGPIPQLGNDFRMIRPPLIQNTDRKVNLIPWNIPKI